jgi:GNAT superfamily N-acetyltransferase
LDYLVNLSTLPIDTQSPERMAKASVTIRRALPPELRLITGWVAVAMSRQPPTCFIATRNRELVGFACHEATARGFFGPTGVDESVRGLGIGRALLFACLNDQKAMGYAYTVIGDVGPSEFYEKTVGAIQIPNSAPGIYAGMLKL